MKRSMTVHELARQLASLDRCREGYKHTYNLYKPNSVYLQKLGRLNQQLQESGFGVWYGLHHDIRRIPPKG